MAICPICGAEVRPRGVNAAFPFCAPRCKAIDLGKWLNEEYRVPVSDLDPDETPVDRAARMDLDEESPSKPDMRH